MSRRSPIRRASQRARDLIWVSVGVQASLLETTLDIAQLVVSADWAVSAGFDRATLLGIRGWLSIAQYVTGTGTDVPGIWLAVYKCGEDSPANSMSPFDAQDYVDFDVLWCGGQSGGVSTTGANTYRSMEVNIKSRRKITSGDQIRLAATVVTDTGSPRFGVSGMLRCLLQLDPPR